MRIPPRPFQQLHSHSEGRVALTVRCALQRLTNSITRFTGFDSANPVISVGPVSLAPRAHWALWLDAPFPPASAFIDIRSSRSAPYSLLCSSFGHGACGLQCAVHRVRAAAFKWRKLAKLLRTLVVETGIEPTTS